MFSLSNKSTYGIAAILHLATHHGRGLVQIKNISAHGDIPQAYLEQLLNRLVKSGIVRAVRGKKGGYALSQDPSHISLLAVLEALEGAVSIAQSAQSFPAIKEVLLAIEQDIRKSLDIPLSDLLARQEEMSAKEMYFI